VVFDADATDATTLTYQFSQKVQTKQMT